MIGGELEDCIPLAGRLAEGEKFSNQGLLEEEEIVLPQSLF